MFRSIKIKFIVTILILGIATLLVSGMVNQYITSKAIIHEEKEQLELIPKLMSESITSMLYFRLTAIQLYASFMSTADIGDELQREEAIKNLSNLTGPYSWTGVISEEGIVLLSSDPRFVGLDTSGDEWFNKTRKPFFPQIGDVHFSRFLYGEPAVCFTSPIQGPDGNFLGVVHSEIGLDYLAGGIRNFRLGKTGYLLLVRKDGRIIADGSGSSTPLERSVSELEAFQAALKGESGTVRGEDIHGLDSFISYQPLGGFMEYPGLGWSILIVRSTEEVMAHARRQTHATTIIIVVVIAIFLLGGFIEARGITGPITKIFNRVGEFSRGDFSRPLEVKSNDELGKLAGSFNEMAESLMERERQLKSTLNYLDYLVSSSVDTIISTDVHGSITFFNTAAHELLGYSPEEALGKHISDFYGGGREEAKKIMERLNTHGNYKSFETELVTRDGRRVPMSVSASLLKNEKGEVLGTLGIGKDLTETKELQSQLVHQEKMVGVGMLAAGIAHEIGNPLTSLSSLVQMLQRKVPGKGTSDKLDIMGEHIEKISKIVRELVDFSRPPSYQWKYSQVNDIIRAAVGLMKYDGRGKFVTMETQLTPDLPMVRIIEDQLMQVFLNIILNAFDAMEEGGKLTIRSDKENGQINISFEDTGEGIPNENLDKIFDPFFTTKEVGKGTGLGLSVSYGVVKNLGGDIMVGSSPRKGAIFTVLLPIAEGNCND